MGTIGTGELRTWIEEGRDFVLLDVLGKEAFDAARLPGARNACVYEVSFLDQVEAAKDATIVVYGSSAQSLDAADAQEQLQAAGYADVRRYEGGRTAWQEAGHAFEGTDGAWVARPGSALRDGTYALDPKQSWLDWTGRNIGNRHFGTLRFLAGSVEIRDARPASAEFEIDMRSIEVGDLEGDLAQALVNHLASRDFFLTENYPTAHIELHRAQAKPDPTDGTPNYACVAELTLRDTTAPVDFDALIAPKGDDIALQANFDFDRTRWGVNYGSGRLYEWLAGHLVNDLITVQVNAVASPA
jgi:polyisoprenoid-binding protein YceI